MKYKAVSADCSECKSKGSIRIGCEACGGKGVIYGIVEDREFGTDTVGLSYIIKELKEENDSLTKRIGEIYKENIVLRLKLENQQERSKLWESAGKSE